MRGQFLENLAFDRIGRHLSSKAVPVPEIYYADHGSGCFVLEDLGDTSLQAYVAIRDDSAAVYEKVLRVLLDLQHNGSEGFDPGWCCQTRRYDHTVMMLLEGCYFKEAFLRRYVGMTGTLGGLERCFFHCAEMVNRHRCFLLLHRDFQSRNVMMSEGRVRIIDWQGARIGPSGYDPASLAVDPYVNLDDGLRSFLIQTYLAMLRDRLPSEAENFRATYPYLAVQRNMQILGAFAHLSLTEGKRQFEAFIPTALRRLKDQLEETADRALSPLKEIVREVESRLQ